MKERTQDWIGRGVVAAVMALGIVLTGCGGDEPEGQGTNPRLPQERAVAVQPASAVREVVEPVAAPTAPAVTGPVSYETAETAWREGRFGDAVTLFTRYTEDRPGNPWGHYMLGLSARRTGDLATAERAFETAIAADPDHVKSVLNLTRTLLDAGRAEEALIRARRAIALDPGQPDGYRLEGLAQAALGHEFEALGSYRNALLLDPSDGWSANNLGLLHLRAGRSDQAIGPLAQAVTVRPDVAVFRNNLGMALEHVGAWGQAAAQYGLAADGGHARAGANRDRVTPLAGEGEPLIDLAERAERFLAGLVGEESAAPPVVPDSIVTLPGESPALSLLFEDVRRRWSVR